ncbi:MAG TPA: DnaJ domain-containing protein [Chitinophagaceae bacterium]
MCLLKNYYQILDLDFNATLAEVKKAYRRLAMQYHPDKTDNELLKARFAEVKEAYEVLSDPSRRREYDLRFDNFSYRRQQNLTPLQLLQKARQLKENTGRRDPHRMDLDRLEFEITELLSEKNTGLLKTTPEQELVQRFIETIIETARPLSPQQYLPVYQQLYPLADEATQKKMQALLISHRNENRWQRYKIVFALVAGLLLCLLIYWLAGE